MVGSVALPATNRVAVTTPLTVGVGAGAGAGDELSLPPQAASTAAASRVREAVRDVEKAGAVMMLRMAGSGMVGERGGL
jgi:hypothetical protein